MADFPGTGIDAFRVFMRTLLSFLPYFPLTPTIGRFYFHWALLLKSSLRSCKYQLSITGHKLSSELGQRLGFKVGFKELQLEPKFLNRGLVMSPKILYFFLNLSIFLVEWGWIPIRSTAGGFSPSYSSTKMPPKYKVQTVFIFQFLNLWIWAWNWIILKCRFWSVFMINCLGNYVFSWI